MEKELSIETSDDKLICGILSKFKAKAERLVIFTHGFAGNMNEHIFFNAAKFLDANGYDTFRFNLYAGENKRSRHFHDTKISLHGTDITTVVNFFRKDYKKIYVAGHSYGGTALLFTDQDVIDGYIFWDASYIDPVKDSTEDMEYNDRLGKYILDLGMEILVGKDFVEELKNFPDCSGLIKKIKKPVLLITAGSKGNSKAGIKYFESANNPKKLVNIESADHNFNNWKDEAKLIEETYNWINSQLV